MAFTPEVDSDGLQTAAAPDVFETIFDVDQNLDKTIPDTMLLAVDSGAVTTVFRINGGRTITVPRGAVVPVRALSGFTTIEAKGIGGPAVVGWGPGVFAG